MPRPLPPWLPRGGLGRPTHRTELYCPRKWRRPPGSAPAATFAADILAAGSKLEADLGLLELVPDALEPRGEPRDDDLELRHEIHDGHEAHEAHEEERLARALAVEGQQSEARGH